MTTITIQPEIAQQITQFADYQKSTFEAVIEQALRDYMAHFRQQKIRSEMTFFEQQKKNLLETYQGQYVAVHNQRVIDHDQDLRTLHLRIHARLGQMPVLLKCVTSEPEQDLVFR